MADNYINNAQMNIFQPVEESSKPRKMMVKKKKKKKKQKTLSDLQRQQQELALLASIMSPNSKGHNKIAMIVNSIDNKSFQEMIIQAKKPKRMPPPNAESMQQEQEEQSSCSHEQMVGQLIFHKPAANILTMKNRKRKKLFETGENDQLAEEQAGQDQVLNKLRKEEANQIPIQPVIFKPKTKQQRMLQNLKIKYGQSSQIGQFEIKRTITKFS